jgi:hypothetical protein
MAPTPAGSSATASAASASASGASSSSAGSSAAASDRRALWRQYHIVRRDQLERAPAADAARELNLRVAFARRFYKNRYDRRHRAWMERLVRHVTEEQGAAGLLHLTLDALAALDASLAPQRR